MLEETRGRRAIRDDDDDGDRTVSVLSPLLVRPANICFNLRPAVRPLQPVRALSLSYSLHIVTMPLVL